MITIFEKLENFVKKVFKTSMEIFFEALRLSPNAQGYVSGSITELLLKQYFEEKGFVVKRIREKWEGKKHPNHHGDFYFKDNNERWFVLESKGIKSNSEKWHKLYNIDKLQNFLYSHHEKISWIDDSQDIEEQIARWIENNLPKFMDEYSTILYDYEEVQKYIANAPKKETAKSKAISLLANLSRDEINSMIEQRLNYLSQKIRVLETHFVSGVSGSNDRTQATPRKDEFNIISIDIFLKYSEHKFLFANPKLLDSSGSDPDHLQQNYIMGFVFLDNDSMRMDLSDEWFNNLEEALDTLNSEDAINEDEMQEDIRNLIIIE